ncbi:MAG: hypothetical protein GKR77_02015 [Legionellales bacterium]|nr:hypothetical protein [Legionellales bacterium]
MADEEDKVTREEEYQLVEPEQTEQTDVFGVQSSSNKVDFKSILESPMRKRILLVLGIVVLIFIVYKLLGLFFSPSQGPASITIPEVPRSQTRVIEEPTPVAQTFTPASTSTMDSATELEALKRRLQTMEQNGLRTHEDVSQVANTLSTVAKTLEHLDNKVSQLRVSLANLSDQFDQQKYQLSQLQEQHKPTETTESKVAERPQKTVFHIQAIIPGRAWLKSNNGTTLTISEGQTIPGMGQVKIIDPIQGRVVLSSGQLIEYSPTES